MGRIHNLESLFMWLTVAKAKNKQQKGFENFEHMQSDRFFKSSTLAVYGDWDDEDEGGTDQHPSGTQLLLEKHAKPQLKQHV